MQALLSLEHLVVSFVLASAGVVWCCMAEPELSTWLCLAPCQAACIRYAVTSCRMM